jgi:hypothetical protein
MARVNDLAKMFYAELAKMQADIERIKIEKQNAERSAVRQKQDETVNTYVLVLSL